MNIERFYEIKEGVRVFDVVEADKKSRSIHSIRRLKIFKEERVIH